MPLSVRKFPTILPSYSLTGDLLSYLRCPLQYRYYNKASLPPSTPVQQWFGEYIHGVMELAFFYWRDRNWRRFPWDWDAQIRPVEMEVFRRLAARGMMAPPNLFRRYREGQPPERLIASERAENAINIWGPHLFPIIENAEVRLKGSRKIPASVKNPRSSHFSITGVVDVISSIKLADASLGSNEIAIALSEIPEINARLSCSEEPFDVIVDYKGMRRPPKTSELWKHHHWQILTYAWLRNQQEPTRNIVAGVLLYLNELTPSNDDYAELFKEVTAEEPLTDVLPMPSELENFRDLRSLRRHGLTEAFRKTRSLRIVQTSGTAISEKLSEFDNAVAQIEAAVSKEIAGASIVDAWPGRADKSTCVACDFKYDCNTAKAELGNELRTPLIP